MAPGAACIVLGVLRAKGLSSMLHSCEALVCVVQALVMDTAALSRQSKSLDNQLANIRHLSEKPSGQLVRSAWVFSNALGIPSPLSESAAER